MKKIMIYALAACATLMGAGCSKEPAGMDISSLDGGNHVLTELSASLESDTDETRTSLQTSNNNVVYWSTKDRILLVNTTTYDWWYYELTAGAGTSIGRFEPLGDAATCEEDMSNIVAVYPAIAAVVDKANKTLSFTINENWNATDEGKKKLSDCGIRSWNIDSPTAFGNNDIKVSYHANGTANGANFKFRQLGTWCTLAFDFTADASVRKESLQSVEITTTTGDAQISGTQQVDLSDPNTPALAAKISGLTDADKTVKWTFNTPASMLTAFTKSLMLFPGLENKQLKITAETNMRTLVFYAKPTTKFEPGTVLRFPIGFKQNFNTEIQPTDDPTTYALAYTNTEKELYPFYYYGDANCHLITGSNTECTIDVTPHKASPYYEKNDAEATAAKKATWAKVIWYETAMGEPSINNSGNSAAITGNSFTVKLADAGQYGNALVGIYENETSDTPLWSYHIWHPEDDPTLAVDPTNPKAMKLYENTYSGTYTVMPMALGATKVVFADDTDTEKIKGAGLWYQWGRKDPLGRASYWGNGGANTPATVAVTAFANTIPDFATGVTEAVGQGYFFTSYKAGADNMISLVNEMYNAGYTESVASTGVDNTEVEKEIDGQLVMVSADRYMIDKVVANPTKLVCVANAFFNNVWTGLVNNYLWGNPEGYNYPRMSATYKSVFDPCPDGYRMPPKDLWINFVVNGGNTTNPDPYYFNVKGGGKITGSFNKGWTFYYKGMGTVTLNENGDAIGYTEPTDGLADFYPASGFRRRETGLLNYLGTNGFAWASSPGNRDSATRGEMEFTKSILYIFATQQYSFANPIRCVKELNE